jgi:hypothetical protein
MASKDWFRCETWDEPISAAFEARLARSRGPFHRAQYLRIQGLTLTGTQKRREVEAGRALLERVIADYPDEHLDVAGAHSALAHSFVSENRLREAIDHLRLCLALESGRSFKHGAELELAEALTASDPDAAERDEVAALLDAAADSAFFHSERWRIAVCRARFCAEVGDAKGAAGHANEALALLADNTPKLPRHKDLGLIDADPATVKEMQKLASRSSRRLPRLGSWLGSGG